MCFLILFLFKLYKLLKYVFSTLEYFYNLYLVLVLG